ncbi:MAG: hypothetical protein LBB72_03855 [Spirochaetaceae bacterium]|jgi:hypothetical protein|nr:hypothetical protein [Spirochaetaceae bacterium]
MRNIFEPVFFRIALAAAIVSVMAGCDNGPGDVIPPDEPAAITVQVRLNSSDPKVLRGGEVTFLVSVKGTTDKAVTWSIDEEGKHRDTRIHTNAEGVAYLFVAENEALETLTVRATSNTDPDKSGTVTVIIPIPFVDKVEISLREPWVIPWQEKVDVGPGGTIEFTAKVIGKDFISDAINAITWSIDNADKSEATTITIDNNGVAQLRVAQNETLASFKVQAVSKWDADKIGEVTVTVKEPTVTGVVIFDQRGNNITSDLKNPRKIKTADSESFRAVVTGTGKIDQAVTWKIERLTYLISLLDIRPNDKGEYLSGWGSLDLEIDLDDETAEYNTWYWTGEETDNYFLIYEPKPVERIPGSREIKVWFTDDAGENEQKTLKPAAGTTGIDQDGKLTVNGQELFGKFRLTVVSSANSTVKKEIIIQVDSSSDINIDIPDA